VQRFSISHGLNLLTLQRSWLLTKYWVSAGVGIALAHPENEVHNLTLGETGGLGNSGYHLTGPVGVVAGGRELRLVSRLALRVEIRGTLSRVEVPIASGEARLTSAALHALLGLTIRL
jgi:hypothetical protein